MKAVAKGLGGRIAFEVTAETPKDLVAQIADIQEVFDAETACGICGSVNIRLSHRVVESYHFYELACPCGGQFAFGQKKQGGALFPKRHGEAGELLPNGGWKQYRGLPAPGESPSAGVKQTAKDLQYEPPPPNRGRR